MFVIVKIHFGDKTNNAPIGVFIKLLKLILEKILNEKGLPEKEQTKDNILY